MEEALLPCGRSMEGGGRCELDRAWGYYSN